MNAEKAASEIQTIITEMEKEIQITQKTEVILVSQAKEQEVAFDSAISTFHDVIRAVGEISDNMAKIAAATKEQSLTTDEVIVRIHNVSDNARETANSATESSNATIRTSDAAQEIPRHLEELNQSVQKVSDQINRFKT